MPLSEYEQRVLEQMERALTSDDPRLANTFESGGRRPVVRYMIAAVGLLGGLLLLVLGAALSNMVLGIIGFVVMFAAVAWAFASKPKAKGPEGVVRPDGKTGPRPAKPARPSGFMARMEARWDRRRGHGR